MQFLIAKWNFYQLFNLLNFCNVFRNNRSNVSLVFHQFENQGRHTVHTHILVWLKNVANIDVDHIRASIPKDDTFLACLVRCILHFFSTPNNCYSEMSLTLNCFKQVLVSYIEKVKYHLDQFL